MFLGGFAHFVLFLFIFYFIFLFAHFFSFFTEISDKQLEEVASRTLGFSGRELSKLCIAIQANAYASERNVVSREMFNKTVESYLAQHVMKDKWADNEHADDAKDGKRGAYGMAMPSS